MINTILSNQYHVVAIHHIPKQLIRYWRYEHNTNVHMHVHIGFLCVKLMAYDETTSLITGDEASKVRTKKGTL